MKKFLLAVAVLCVGTMALAGPNQGGTLVAHDAGLLLSATNGSASICGQGSNLASCDAAVTEIDGAGNLGGDAAIWKVYAAFVPGSSPRLMGLTWGVTYDMSNIILPFYGKCGDFELNDDGWPQSGKGSTVTWNTVQTSILTAVYYFGAYTYGAPGVLALGPNPSQGGYFGDDSVPAILDPIAGYGAMGFDMPGALVCPGVVPTGACCDPNTGGCVLTPADQCMAPDVWHPEWQSCDPNPCPPPQVIGACCNPDTGECVLTTAADCAYNWHPEWTSCDPNPCPPPTPAEKASWGQIKHAYH